MPSEPIVREALETDAEELQRYVAEAMAGRLPTVLGVPKPPTVEEEREFLGACIRSPNSVVLVAESGGELVGMLGFHGHKGPQRRLDGVHPTSTDPTGSGHDRIEGYQGDTKRPSAGSTSTAPPAPPPS